MSFLELFNSENLIHTIWLICSGIISITVNILWIIKWIKTKKKLPLPIDVKNKTVRVADKKVFKWIIFIKKITSNIALIALFILEAVLQFIPSKKISVWKWIKKIEWFNRLNKSWQVVNSASDKAEPAKSNEYQNVEQRPIKE